MRCGCAYSTDVFMRLLTFNQYVDASQSKEQNLICACVCVRDIAWMFFREAVQVHVQTCSWHVHMQIVAYCKIPSAMAVCEQLVVFHAYIYTCTGLYSRHRHLSLYACSLTFSPTCAQPRAYVHAYMYVCMVWMWVPICICVCNVIFLHAYIFITHTMYMRLSLKVGELRQRTASRAQRLLFKLYFLSKSRSFVQTQLFVITYLKAVFPFKTKIKLLFLY